MILKDLLRSARQQLEQAAIQTAALDARVLLKARLGLSDADLITQPDMSVPSDIQQQFTQDIQARLAGMPVSKILGHKEFWGLDFKVTQDTLSPRPETEILVEAALTHCTNAASQRSSVALSLKGEGGPPRSGEGERIQILDLGTGTGCIPISLLKELPHAQAVCVDLSEAALNVARENAHTHDVEDRTTFLQSDWYGSVPRGMSFDIITSNPPYIPNPDIQNLSKEVKNHDPILALDGGTDGLKPYKIILEGLIHRLKPGGRAYLECGAGQAEDIARLVDDSDATLVRLISDLAGIDRVLEICCGDK